MTNTSLIHKCKIIENKRICENIYRIKFKSPDIAVHSSPGQFLQLRVTENLDPFLRRPFSISRVDKKLSVVEILYKIIGRGTTLMTEFKKDDLLDIMGPLGNSFNTEGNFNNSLIVAGGIGGAPVFYLMDELLKKRKKITLIYGTQNINQLIDFDRYKDHIDLVICTEDGSCGTKGLVTDVLKEHVRNSSEIIYAFACGPNAMYKQIQNLFPESKTVYWQVSMESNMACGTGVCQGCAIKMRTNNLRFVCTHGPVFNLEDINFND